MQTSDYAEWYNAYSTWFDENKIQGTKAETFGAMINQLLKAGKFSEIYEKSDIQSIRDFVNTIRQKLPNNETAFRNWMAA